MGVFCRLWTQVFPAVQEIMAEACSCLFRHAKKLEVSRVACVCSRYAKKLQVSRMLLVSRNLRLMLSPTEAHTVHTQFCKPHRRERPESPASTAPRLVNLSSFVSYPLGGRLVLLPNTRSKRQLLPCAEAMLSEERLENQLLQKEVQALTYDSVPQL